MSFEDRLELIEGKVYSEFSLDNLRTRKKVIRRRLNKLNIDIDEAVAAKNELLAIKADLLARLDIINTYIDGE